MGVIQFAIIGAAFLIIIGVLVWAIMWKRRRVVVRVRPHLDPDEVTERGCHVRIINKGRRPVEFTTFGVILSKGIITYLDVPSVELPKQLRERDRFTFYIDAEWLQRTLAAQFRKGRKSFFIKDSMGIHYKIKIPESTVSQGNIRRLNPSRNTP